ncbi:MAG: VCBS repeat-containing protein [Deltaproteobacteria bacterium]|nr:VCBS repeat-containing protein [Deltaproteobacteria bacterium]
MSNHFTCCLLPLALLLGCGTEGVADDPPGGADDPPGVAFEGWRPMPAPAFRSEGPPGGPASIEQGEDRTNGGGAALMDFTGDAIPDLVLTAPWSGSEVFVGDGVGGFAPVPNPTLSAVPMSACAIGLHMDNDGLRDLLLCGDNRVSAWRNLGGAVFEHVMDVLDFNDVPARAEDIAVTDLYGDGSLYLYVGTQSLAGPDGTAPAAHADRLLVLREGFDFEDVSELMPVEGRIGQTYASSWIDIDEDGDLDLFTVRDRGEVLWPAALFVNPGPTGDWTEESVSWGLDLPIDGMGLAQGDIDGDGTTEIVVSDNFSRLHVLSVGDGVVTPRAAELGAVVQNPERQRASWAVELIDAENDGDLDLVLAFGRADPLYDELQQDVDVFTWDGDSYSSSTDFEQTLPPLGDAWRTVLPDDIDGDGALELIFTSHVGDVMVQDPTPSGNHFLRVEAVGPGWNRDGLGARVTLRRGSDRPQWRLVGIGSTGIHSSVSPVAHFGLGRDPGIDQVEVRWSDGSVTTVDAPSADAVIEVRHPLAD